MHRTFRAPAILAACAAMALAACETVPLSPSPNFTGDMVVANEYAQFFRLGPQQAGGADLSLRGGTRVMLLRKEFGYSRVQLEDDQVGYMANEDLQPAPPAPKAPKGRKGKPRGEAREEYYEEPMPVSDPNLNIAPEDLPLEPLPDLVPDQGDTHRVAPPSATPAPAPKKVETLPESTPAEAPPPVSTST